VWAATAFDVGMPMIQSKVTTSSEQQGLQSKTSVLILLMAINLISVIASAQTHPAQSPATVHSRTKDHTVGLDRGYQPGRLEDAPGAADSSGTLAGEAQSGTAAPSAADNPADEAPANKNEKKKKEKRGEILLAPLPISSPAIGTGIIPVVGYIFLFSKQDKISPPSVVGGAGLFTDNGSRALALAGQLYVKQNTSIITAAFLRGHLNYDFSRHRERGGRRRTETRSHTDRPALLWGISAPNRWEILPGSPGLDRKFKHNAPPG
jgi:hypothetical protein